MQQNKDIPPFSNIPNAALILENKKVFWGKGLGAKTAKIGELCFNTSQTGYQEILTDPSYAKQIITFTFPHIGIVGINDLDIESKKIYAFVGNFKKTYLYTIVISEELNKNFINKLTLNLKPF